MSDDGKKITAQKANKRPSLVNITNIRNGLRNFVKSSKPSTLITYSRKISKKKESTVKLPADSSPRTADVLAPVPDTNPIISPAPVPVSVPSIINPNSIISEHENSEASSSKSERSSSSLDEDMSICDSCSSLENNYLDSITVNVSVGENGARDEAVVVEGDGEGLAGKNEDTQVCPEFAFKIYKNLLKSEARKMPSMDYMQNVQFDINASMRAILIDWLVEVAEDYKLVPETLFLTVNYIDRYLSRRFIERKRLQLLGISCMLIASKFEEIKAPSVDEFCYITDHSYCSEEAVEMEADVLKYLNFEMCAPTTTGFLRHFVRAAQPNQQVQFLKFECMANYLAELSLIEYVMLRYPPSMIAASAVFLAKFILSPRNKPWDSTLKNYTLYQPSDLSNCVKALHSHHCRNNDSQLHGVRNKYSQHKHKFVARQYCPTSIPQDFFEDLSS